MQIQILHAEPMGGANFVHVATIDAAGYTGEAALDWAYQLTQNINGSWSRGPTFENGERNGDYSAAVTVLAPLPVHDGRTYGLRSSSIGDLFVIEGRRWRVASFGFEAA